MTEYIDITPTWRECVDMLLAIVENNEDPSRREWARNELRRLGSIVDTYRAKEVEELSNE